jgi:Aminoglycoside adenylyltransferase, C-terminal domain
MNRVPPENIRDLVLSLQADLTELFGDILVGIYLYGASAVPDSLPSGDVDFHAFLTRVPTMPEKREIHNLHERLAADYPPLGKDMDGYYILFEDAKKRTLPHHLVVPGVIDESWALHRAHMLAGRCVVLVGPDPKDIFPEPTWDELDNALLSELKYVAKSLQTYPDYCVLNLCRLLLSYQTKDVVISKAEAAGRMGENLPQFRTLIKLAENSYRGRISQEERLMMLDRVNSMYAFVCQAIVTIRSEPLPSECIL